MNGPKKPLRIVGWLVALALAALTGWVQILFRDLHLALLAAMAFALLLSVLWPQRPWLWALIVGLSPAIAELVLISRGEPIQRGEVEVAFAAILPAIVGAYGGYFMREMATHVFEKPQHEGKLEHPPERSIHR